MKSRLDRYNDSKPKENVSRLSKNKHLYDDLNNKIGFEELVDFNTQTRIELTSLNEQKRSRESYQQLKDYQGLISEENKSQDLHVEPQEEKVFDINSILEEARKNRNEIDDLEKKRKLKNEEYSVLSELNKKYLSKSNDDKKDEYEGLEELINTITSKTLVNDVSELEKKEEQDLLSDLIATNVDLQVREPKEYDNSSPNVIATKIELEDDSGEDNTTEEDLVDNSFYTRSMDLSEQDFDFDDAVEKNGTKRKILIFVVILILLAIIGIVTYFVLQHFNINIKELIK